MNQIAFRLFLLLLLTLFSLWLRSPTIKEGKPFFYQEDEAHHFNRTVNMVKHRSLDPEYFHKPSLHFYLRMPMVLAGLALTPEPEKRTLDSIQTSDRNGLARYAFSWSHPRVVYAVRAVSFALTILTGLLVFIIARQIGLSFYSSLLGYAVYTVSPEIFNYSSYVGVDTPLMFFSLATTSLGLRLGQNLSASRIWLVGLLAGLAVSCKYNGLPIALTPLALIVLNRSFTNPLFLASALISPAVGFFLGSPYIIISFPLFMKHLSYEVWHYAIAGHEGHSAKPGIEQIIHYGKWLLSDGIGTISLGASLIGGVLLIWKGRTQATLMLLFPLLFFALMCAQRVNFVRNMLPLIPYCAVFIAVAVQSFVQRMPDGVILRSVLFIASLIALTFAPFERTFSVRAQMLAQEESRQLLEQWLTTHRDNQETAIVGDLQPQLSIRQLPGVSTIPLGMSFDQIFQNGFDIIVGGSTFDANTPTPQLASGRVLVTFPGDPLPMRIVKNPSLIIYQFVETPPVLTNLSRYPTIDLRLPASAPSPSIGLENYSWITQRLTLVRIPVSRTPDHTDVTFQVMSPWEDQQLILYGNNWSETISPIDLPKNELDPGDWRTIRLRLPTDVLLEGDRLLFAIKRISSPSSHRLSKDKRRLGIAIRIP